MSLRTEHRDYALLDDIASYFEILARDSEGMAARGMDKRRSLIRAQVWREAAADVRSITLTAVGEREAQG